MYVSKSDISISSSFSLFDIHFEVPTHEEFATHAGGIGWFCGVLYGFCLVWWEIVLEKELSILIELVCVR